MKQFGIISVLILIIALSCSIFSLRFGASMGRSLETYSHQRAADRSQTRRQDEQWHKMAIAEAKQTEPYRVAAKQLAWSWIGRISAVSISLGLLATAGAYTWWLIGRVRAAIKREMLSLIKPDPDTGLLPLITYEMAGGIHVYNPNDVDAPVVILRKGDSPKLISGKPAERMLVELRGKKQ